MEGLQGGETFEPTAIPVVLGSLATELARQPVPTQWRPIGDAAIAAATHEPDEPSNGRRHAISIRPLPDIEPSVAGPGPQPVPTQLALDLHWTSSWRVEGDGRVRGRDAQVAKHFMHAIVDVLAGRRPVAQLASKVEPNSYAGLAAQLSCHHAVQVRLRSVHLFQPARGVIEACGTVERERSAQALVARLERLRPGWLCTVLELL